MKPVYRGQRAAPLMATGAKLEQQGGPSTAKIKQTNKTKASNKTLKKVRKRKKERAPMNSANICPNISPFSLVLELKSFFLSVAQQ